MKVKVAEATGPVLDWMVAKSEDVSIDILCLPEGVFLLRNPIWSGRWSPSRSWHQGGPIIDREGIGFYKANDTKWWAHPYCGACNVEGPTALIAAMRCYVASKLGEEVDVPKELIP